MHSQTYENIFVLILSRFEQQYYDDWFLSENIKLAYSESLSEHKTTSRTVGPSVSSNVTAR